MKLSKAWRERCRTAAWLAFGLLLLAALFVMLLLRDPGTRPVASKASETIISLVQPPPPPVSPPPPTRKQVPPRVVKPTPPAPPSEPAPPRPKAPAPPAQVDAPPLTMDTAPDPANDFNVPQGTEQGLAIGGGGGGGGRGGRGDGQGGDGGCSGPNRYLAATYPNLVTSQVRQVFGRNEKTDSRRFRIQARVWFEPSGQVARAELAGTTGDSALDRDVAALLGKLDVKAAIPDCLQPITVWVSQPWTGSFAGKDGAEGQDPSVSSSTVIWQTPATR